MLLKKYLYLFIDQHKPVESEFVKGNQAPFMNKELSKAIMRKSRLRKVHNKLKAKESWKTFNPIGSTWGLLENTHM